MDAPRRDMELLSNSLAAYAHIRGEGRPRDTDPSPPHQAPLHPSLPLLPATDCNPPTPPPPLSQLPIPTHRYPHSPDCPMAATKVFQVGGAVFAPSKLRTWSLFEMG